MKKIFTIVLIIGTLLICFGIFLLYGPVNSFRDWLINTAMSTRTHKYFATWFYDEATIQDSLNRNSISDFGFMTNLDEIQFVDYSKIDNIKYENEYEKQILEKSKENNDYKIINIKGEKYNGYLAVIYDPTRVDLVVTKYLGKDGQYLTMMSEQNNAYVAINGGGFVDPKGDGTGGEPLGITINDGKLIHETVYDKENLKGGLVGLTYSNKLFLGDVTSRQALSIGIGVRDSVSFGPYLIVNRN